jgi:hypothetical protein
MMNAAEEFRLHADECLQQAERAAGPERQAALLSMAEHWNRLALCMDEFAESVVAGEPGNWASIRPSITKADPAAGASRY